MIASLALSLAVSAQGLPQDPSTVVRPALRAPIHTQPDDPVGGRYGLWAAGSNYKVSFHDGFAFHPYIPDAEITRAWRWHTTSVRAGTEELLSGDPVTWHDEQRAEYRSAQVTERYDVRDDGVEQSFVIHARPRGEGAILVRGRLETPFQATITGPRVGALDFEWRGTKVLRYGEARAFDAEGRSASVETAFDGEAIELQVDAEFVSRATFPLTIDPLTSAFSTIGLQMPILDTTVACATAAGEARVGIGSVVRFSATDYDVYFHQGGDTPAGSPFPFFADITTSWSSVEVDAAYVEGPTRFALAFERDFTGGSSGVRIFTCGFLGNDPTSLVIGPAGTRPRIGGSLGSGVTALVVYGAASGTDVHHQVLDMPTSTLGGVVVHETGAANWSVSKLRSPTQSWCVATEVSASNLIRVRFVTSLGLVSTPTNIIAAQNGQQPEVDGDGDRFLLSWRDSTSVGIGQHRLRVQRFDRLVNAVPVGPTRTIATTSTFSDIVNRGLAYDFLTRSHWAIAYEIRTPTTGAVSAYVARLGASGGITESVDLGASAVSQTLPSVAMNGIPPTGTSEREGFAVVGRAVLPVFSDSVIYRLLEYPADAGVLYSGTSCGNATLSDEYPPYAGSEFYRSILSGVAPGTPAFFALGLAPSDVPLDPIGMPRCRLLVDLLATFPAVADAHGVASVVTSLTDSPVFVGDLVAQWIWVDPGANAAGLRTSPRATIRVR